MFDPWKTFRLVIENENSVDITDAYDLLTDADALLEVVPTSPPIHEVDFKGVPCPYGGPGPWDHNECDCGYWGRLEAWAKEIAEALAALPEHLRTGEK